MERRKSVIDLLNCCGTYVYHTNRHSLVTVAASKELEDVEEEIQNIEVTRVDICRMIIHIQRSNDVLVHCKLMTELSVLRADTALDVIDKVERENCDLLLTTPSSFLLQYTHTG